MKSTRLNWICCRLGMVLTKNVVSLASMAQAAALTCICVKDSTLSPRYNAYIFLQMKPRKVTKRCMKKFNQTDWNLRLSQQKWESNQPWWLSGFMNSKFK